MEQISERQEISSLGFSTAKGERFSVIVDRPGELDPATGERFQLELVSVEELPSLDRPLEVRPDPFRLTFRTTYGMNLNGGMSLQGNYRLFRDGFEPFTVFLVPIGWDNGRILLEAIYN